MSRCKDWRTCDARREGQARSIQMVPTSQSIVLPKSARVYAHMRGRQYFLKRVLAHTSRHDGHIIWPEHLEWFAEEKEGTVFDGPEAVMLATNWGAKWKEVK
jgi:hypothetical protein